MATADYRIMTDDPTFEPGPAGEGARGDELLTAVHAAANDAAKGLGWMNDNAAQHGIDPDRIVIGGASSGAITRPLGRVFEITRRPLSSRWPEECTDSNI